MHSFGQYGCKGYVCVCVCLCACVCVCARAIKAEGVCQLVLPGARTCAPFKEGVLHAWIVGLVAHPLGWG